MEEKQQGEGEGMESIQNLESQEIGQSTPIKIHSLFEFRR
jgi:hypothetical protein